MKEKMKWLSPGSVVSMKDARKRLMIVGRLQRGGDGSLFHYAGVIWPEGMLSRDELYLFNQEDIGILWFMGFQEAEEFHFRKTLQTQYDSICEKLS
ncbi:DUF4176 domain-containing protein [Faecalibaculum rodentium]|uniref:DUF4176 domain-containing protein n=1 Tax=Faecalibaculum rodentium TaxID=1702221 RepID=UPI0023F18B35|nr:DUF4176 domain-containing protein [Faecalibaculum rodentium]